MRILGVDTSLRSTGYGVVDTAGSRFIAVEYGNIPNAANLPHSQCLRRIHEKIAALIDEFKPEVLSVEKVIYGKNANTMMVLGEARGAVIVTAAERDVPIYEYEPRRAKMSVCGNGLASKEQVQRMVKTLLNLPQLPQNDAADALALAICHSNSKMLLNLTANKQL
jgi:crossover junction endodeoxyribonuclease RuvC